MITLLDCINRVPLITDSIIEKRGATFKPLIDKWNDELKTINQIFEVICIWRKSLTGLDDPEWILSLL